MSLKITDRHDNEEARVVMGEDVSNLENTNHIDHQVTQEEMFASQVNRVDDGIDNNFKRMD